jgi:thiol-disulfide isomerase/thioredoxin
MNTGKIITITLLAGILSAGAVYLTLHSGRPGNGQSAARPGLIPRPTQALTVAPEFSLPDLQGNEQGSAQWAGKLLVLNFWATWCPPCREEIPDFMALQEELGGKGLQFVGIAIDQADAVRDFAAAQGINYPVLIGNEQSIEMSRQLGNRFQGLPFSVIFGRDGQVIHAQAGQLRPETIREKLTGLL